MAERSPQEVFIDHLRRRRVNDLDGDIEHNYADDVVLMTGYGIFHGKEGVRASAGVLYQQLHNANYLYRTQLVHGPIGFLEWSAETATIQVRDGADSYWISDGRIHVQTIHYTVVSVKVET